MPALERRTSLRGPRFWTDGPFELHVSGQHWDTLAQLLMFVNHIDGSTRDGPRPATQADIDAHPQALVDCEQREADEAAATERIREQTRQALERVHKEDPEHVPQRATEQERREARRARIREAAE